MTKNGTLQEKGPIGVFDSGVGGLSLLLDLRRLLPNEDFIYYGDRANAPYGAKTHGEILEISKGIVNELLSRGAKAIVVACNTATAWGFEDVSKKGAKENVPVVGVIGAGVRSALSLNDVASAEGAISIGVMATPGTIASGAYERMILAEARKLGLKASIKVFSQGCAGLADAVEAGSPKANEIALANYRELVKKHSADASAGPLKAVILGCTHYPFVLSALKKEASSVVFVDPAAATAEECYLNLRRGRLLRKRGRIALSAFISVPASGLDRRFLDDRGNLTRQCKYSRELNDETCWTEIRPYLASDASGNRFIRSSLPLTWSLLAEKDARTRSQGAIAQ